MSHFYKNVKETEFKVGFFLLVCMIILFFSYSWLNDWFLKSRYDILQVLFDSVNNLERGNSVYYRGVRIGRVNGLVITDKGVLVDLQISHDIIIDDSALFVIKDKDMMGTKSVEIFPGGSNNGIDVGKVYYGKSLPGLSDLISNLNVLTNQVESIISRLDQNEELFIKIDRIIEQTDESIQQAQILLKSINDSDLLTAFSELKNASTSIQNLISEHSEGINNTLELTQNTFSRIDSLIINSSNIIVTLQDNFQNKNGNLNKLINDHELYDNLVNSTKELETLISDIKKNPRRYFKFSIF